MFFKDAEILSLLFILTGFKPRVKSKLHERLQRDKEFTAEDEEFLNPCNKISISNALKFIKNPVRWVTIWRWPIKTVPGAAT